jgi:hypothetical protein
MASDFPQALPCGTSIGDFLTPDPSPTESLTPGPSPKGKGVILVQTGIMVYTIDREHGLRWQTPMLLSASSVLENTQKRQTRLLEGLLYRIAKIIQTGIPSVAGRSIKAPVSERRVQRIFGKSGQGRNLLPFSLFVVYWKA